MVSTRLPRAPLRRQPVFSGASRSAFVPLPLGNRSRGADLLILPGCPAYCLQRSWLEAAEGEEVAVGGVAAEVKVAHKVGRELREHDAV